MIRILPESTRWLISKNRYAEAKALILEAAKMNNKSISSDSFEIKENNSFVEVNTVQVLLTIDSIINRDFIFTDQTEKLGDHCRRLQVESAAQTNFHHVWSLVPPTNY